MKQVIEILKEFNTRSHTYTPTHIHFYTFITHITHTQIHPIIRHARKYTQACAHHPCSTNCVPKELVGYRC